MEYALVLRQRHNFIMVNQLESGGGKNPHTHHNIPSIGSSRLLFPVLHTLSTEPVSLQSRPERYKKNVCCFVNTTVRVESERLVTHQKLKTTTSLQPGVLLNISIYSDRHEQ